MTLHAGEIAPQIELFDTDKQKVKLEDYKGKNVLILFFPLAFTSVCTAELCEMRDSLAEFQTLNTDILAISVDSPQTLNAYKMAQQYNFTMLSDFNKEVSRSYGSIYEQFSLGMRGVSKRSAFVVDKNGIIQYAEVLENAGEVPNFAAIKAILSNLNQ